MHKNTQLHVPREASEIETGVIFQQNYIQEKLPERQEWKEDKHNSTKHEKRTV